MFNNLFNNNNKNIITEEDTRELVMRIPTEEILNFFSNFLFGIFYFEWEEGRTKTSKKLSKNEQILFQHVYHTYIKHIPEDEAPYDIYTNDFYLAMLEMGIVSILLKIPEEWAISKERKLSVFADFLTWISIGKSKGSHYITETKKPEIYALIDRMIEYLYMVELMSNGDVESIDTKLVSKTLNSINDSFRWDVVFPNAIQCVRLAYFIEKDTVKEMDIYVTREILKDNLEKYLLLYKKIFFKKGNSGLSFQEFFLKNNFKSSFPELNELDAVLNMLKKEKIAEKANSLSEWYLSSHKTIADVLKENIVGQDDAIEQMTPLIGKLALGLNKRPVSALFCWESGVGKTQLAVEIANLIESEVCLINMGNMESSASLNMLLGSPPGYINSGTPTILENYLQKIASSENKKAFPIIIFDEIEKASPVIYNMWLELFDRWTVTLLSGNTLDLSNSLIVMTSNLWAGEENNRIGFQITLNAAEEAQREKEKYEDSIWKAIPIEVLNRIEKTIIFNSLTENDFSNIKNLSIRKIFTNLLEKNDILKKAVWEKDINTILKDIEQSLQSYDSKNIRWVEREIENYILNLILRQYE